MTEEEKAKKRAYQNHRYRTEEAFRLKQKMNRLRWESKNPDYSKKYYWEVVKPRRDARRREIVLMQCTMKELLDEIKRRNEEI